MSSAKKNLFILVVIFLAVGLFFLLKTKPQIHKPSENIQSTQTLMLKKLSGPFASLSKFCEFLQTKNSDHRDSECDIEKTQIADEDSRSHPVTQSLKNLESPYQDVIFFTIRTPRFEAIHMLGIQINDNWYVYEDAAYTHNPGAFGISEETQILEFTLKRWEPLENPIVVLRTEHRVHDLDRGLNEYTDFSAIHLMICAVDAAKTPSCSESILESFHNRRDLFSALDEEEEASEWEHELYDLKAESKISFQDTPYIQIKKTREEFEILEPKSNKIQKEKVGSYDEWQAWHGVWQIKFP